MDRIAALEDTTLTSDPFIVQQSYNYDADGALWLEHSRELDSFQDPSVNIYDQTRSYHSIDGKLSVVNRHIGNSTPWQARYRTGYLCGMRLTNALERFRQQILAVAEANGAISISVFGSVARGEDTPESDVDFLVHLQPGRTLLDLTRLELALEALLGRHVDVLTEESLHEPIRSTAIRQAICV